MRVFVTGGTGLIGRQVMEALASRGHVPVCLSRSAQRGGAALPPGAELVVGDPRRPGPWQDAAADCDAAVNLVGESLFGLAWTGRKKRRLRRSRLAPTRNLVEALHRSDRPRLLLSASAVGYYGDGGEKALGEDSEPGCDFLARLTREWESTALQAERKGTRVVVARFGVVLARQGGALPVMRRAYRFGLGGRLGNGRQFFPWVHIQDLVRALLFCLETEGLSGPVNVVAPDPPRQGEFARALGRAVGRPAWLHVPGFLVRALLGEEGELLLLQGQRVVPKALRAHGFVFEHADLPTALRELLS